MRSCSTNCSAGMRCEEAQIAKRDRMTCFMILHRRNTLRAPNGHDSITASGMTRKSLTTAAEKAQTTLLHGVRPLLSYAMALTEVLRE